MKRGALTKLRSFSGVDEYQLSNGLRILHRRDTSAPLCAVMVVYHVGSRNEALGHTGSTHILEHLLFKDTEHFKKAEGRDIFPYLETMGAELNATTGFDRTNYFELFPKEHFREVLTIEASRMRNSLFSAADLATEMTVVRNEYERSRNNPGDLLEEAVWAAAFAAHPYHHPIIGWKDDIEGSTAEKLREFYDRYYHPDNATLIVIGDISPTELAKEVPAAFGRIPQAPAPIPPMTVVELPQEGPRRVELHRPGETTLIMVGHKSPRATDQSMPVLMLFSQILAGGLSSRLERALVDTGLSVSVSPFLSMFFDPGLFTVTTQVAPKVAPEKVLAAIRSALTAIATKGVRAAELSRAKSQLLAHMAYERDGYLDEAYVLGEAVAAGDWTLAYRLGDAISAVTAKDIQVAAQELVREETETVGILVPKKSSKKKSSKKSV